MRLSTLALAGALALACALPAAAQTSSTLPVKDNTGATRPVAGQADAAGAFHYRDVMEGLSPAGAPDPLLTDGSGHLAGLRSGAGGFVTVPTTPGVNGAALPAGVVGTRIYVDASSDSVTYAIEPAAQCGASAPGLTRTVAGPNGGADENLTGGLVVCVTAAAGAPRARAY